MQNARKQADSRYRDMTKILNTYLVLPKQLHERSKNR
jgi:hypothetical protein